MKKQENKVIHNLLPREDSFFQQFQEQAALAKKAGAMLSELVNDYGNLDKHVKSIDEVERQGDHIVHETAKQIAQSFVTPIDREDIHALCANLDDILDFIQESALCMRDYNVSKPTQAACNMAEQIKAATEAMEEAVNRLINLKDVDDIRDIVKKCEKEADKVSREAISMLFKEEKNAIELIKWKEIYGSLGIVTDKCKDVMDVLEGILLKYA